MGAVGEGEGEVNVEASGERMFLKGDEYGVGVRENGGADGEQKKLGVERAVVEKRDSDLRHSMTASLISSETPR